MKNQTRYSIFLGIIGFTFMTLLSGCSSSRSMTTLSNQDTSYKSETSSMLHTFDESKNWVNPNSSPYPPGLTYTESPKVPSAFEQSIRPKTGVASIFVSRANGSVGSNNFTAKNWTQEIQFSEPSFKINGQTCSVPAEYAKQNLLLLPIDKGIVWAPVESQIPDPSHLQQALQGTTDIFYTPYLAQGGSLANGAQLIAQLPHQWLGLDGPVIGSAWTGWLPKDNLFTADVKTETAYHLEYTKKNQEKTAGPVQGNVPGWPTLYLSNLNQSSYYQKPHYAAYVQRLTRTYGGFVLEVNFVDATQSGQNAGMSAATYYWSEQSRKWTPLAQNYTDQTLAGWTDIGSNGVYWVQPCSVDNGSGSALDAFEMYFDPGSLTIQSVWLGDWLYGPSFVDGDSWVAVLANDMPTSVSAQPKKWTVYTSETDKQSIQTNPLFDTSLVLPNRQVVTPEQSVRWKDLLVSLQIRSLPNPGPQSYLGILSNHSTVLSHSSVSTSAGTATLILNERTPPAAAQSSAPTYEYWVIVYGNQCAYAIEATVVGNREKAQNEVMELLNNWKVPQ